MSAGASTSPLAQSRALIVGGSSGVGAATAQRLLEGGIGAVAVSGRNPERVENAVARLAQGTSARVTGLAFDASDAEACASGIADAEAALGQIDILVSCVAGDVVPELLLESPVHLIEETLRAQMLAPLLLTRLALPHMCQRGRGSVVLVASDAAKVATPGEAAIGAAMAGIVMFAKTAAMEVKRHGVRVNAVTPSLVSGTRTTERITADGFSAKLFAAAEKQAHLGVTQPQDVAELITFLAGPDSRRITGQAISINSGISAA